MSNIRSAAPPPPLSSTGIGSGANYNVGGGNGSPLLAGSGGFNKPPLAPASGNSAHSMQHRGRGHSHAIPPPLTDCSVAAKISHDRTNISGMSCSLPGSREKSPNSGGAVTPDFHDCSMCLSAYIQALNTVCGSASRLSQCLAALSNNTHNNVNGGNGAVPSQQQQYLREVCEGWETLTRAVGVASASVKADMFALLQEASKGPSTMGGSDDEPLTRNELAKKQHMEVLASLCSGFMNLQCQFSGAVLETFGPYSSLLLTPPPSSLDTTSQYSTPVTPPHFTAQLTPPPGGNFVLNSSGVAQSSSSIKARARANSMNYINPLSHNSNLQPPGLVGAQSDNNTMRRWSMGASGYTYNNCGGGVSSSTAGSAAEAGVGNVSPHPDALDGGGNTSGPGPPRRWSVPEANEPPPLSATSTLSGVATPWSVSSVTGTPWGITATTQQSTDQQLQPDSNRRLSVPVPPASSRESSAGGSRSNSHSRSATPDPGKSSSNLISMEELDEITDMLSSSGGITDSSTSRSRQGGSISSTGDDTDNGSERKSPCQHQCKHTHHHCHSHKLCTAANNKTKIEKTTVDGGSVPSTTSRSDGDTSQDQKLLDDKGGTNASRGKPGGHAKKLSGNAGGYMKGSAKHHPRQRSSYCQFANSQQHKRQYHIQQYQLQQYLYQQQLQANAYLKLSPISSSILKQQQQYVPILQQHLYQQQQLQQLKFNQSLQLLHLQQQQQQQQRLQQHRKNSLQNMGSYYQDFGSVYCDTPDDSSSNNSRRGSANTTASSCSNGGGGAPGRTPVIHEATVETVDGGLDGSGNTPHSPRWQEQMAKAPPPIVEDKSECLRGGQPNTIPEVVTTSTPLWPPSGSVPGVTLTECTEEFRAAPHHHGGEWVSPHVLPENEVQEDRDAAIRSSWPSNNSIWSNSGFSLTGLLEDNTLRGLMEPPSFPQRQQQSTMRRHSTDTASYHQQQQDYHKYQPPPPLPLLTPGRNSRSSEHLHLAPELSEIVRSSSGCLDSNIESLLTLNALLPNSSPPSPTAHYSLFNS